MWVALAGTVLGDVPIHVSAAFGAYGQGQLRRDFHQYIEQIRAVPWRQWLHYNSWYQLRRPGMVGHVSKPQMSRVRSRHAQLQHVPLTEKYHPARVLAVHHAAAAQFLQRRGARKVLVFDMLTESSKYRLMVQSKYRLMVQSKLRQTLACPPPPP